MQDFIIPKEVVTWGNRETISLEVRGLSFQDFSILFSTHGKEVEELFPFIEGLLGAKPDEPLDAKVFGQALLMKAPAIVAHLIALATDMPGRADEAGKLAILVQLRLLEAIWIMTIEEAGGLQDFFELLLRMIRQVKQAIPSMNSNQQNPYQNLNTGS